MDEPRDVIIIGAGLSGLSVFHFLKKNKFRPDRMLILEKDSRAGGAIRSCAADGYLAEWGAHGFLDNVAESRELLADTGLDREAQKAPLGNFVRYICLDGKLAMIPQHPLKIIKSSLLPLTGKLRVLADLWKKPRTVEQTVSQWAAYRFGRGVLPFVDAVFTGTYAGDAERLSMDAVMPGIRRLELAEGSVLRGLLKKRKAAAGKKSGLPAMVSFPQGMTRLVDVLAEDAGIQFNTSVDSIRRIGNNNEIWEVRAGGGVYKTRTVVLALSVNQSLALLSAAALAGVDKPVLASLPTARVVNVVMGFTDNTAEIPFGFGYLAPEREKRFALGALFSTHMFPGRAPRGRVLLEALVGGRRHPEKVDLDDDELIRKSYEDISRLIKLPEPPCFTRVLRPPQGIPQLELGYPALLAWRNNIIKEQKGLYICGFGWEGIGINDMTKAAKSVAEAIARGAAHGGDEAAVKGVYF